MGQGQSGPQGPTGPRGDPGPQGPPGEKGKDASGDPQQVASLLSSDPGFAARVVPIISKDNSLGQTVAQQIASNQVSQNLLTNALVTNKTFAGNVINSMALDPRFKGPQGQSGAAFDELSMQAALVPKSLWCADGEVCRIPTSSPGTYLTGDTIIQRAKTLYLGGAAVGTSGSLTIDTKHGVIVKDANPIDGPFIYGNKGGQLGVFDQANSTSGIPTLTWDSNNVVVKGNLAQRGFEFQLGLGDTTRGDSVQSRAMVKDQGNLLTINKGNDFVGGTQVDSDLSVTTGKLKIGKWSLQNEGDDLKLLNKDNKEVLRIDTNGKIKNNNWFIEATTNRLKIQKEGSTGQFSFNDEYGKNNYLSLSDNYRLIDQEGLLLNQWRIAPTSGNLAFGNITAGNNIATKFTVQPDNNSTVAIGNWKLSANNNDFTVNKHNGDNSFRFNDAPATNSFFSISDNYKFTDNEGLRVGDWAMNRTAANLAFNFFTAGNVSTKFTVQPDANGGLRLGKKWQLIEKEGRNADGTGKDDQWISFDRYGDGEKAWMNRDKLRHNNDVDAKYMNVDEHIKVKNVQASEGISAGTNISAVNDIKGNHLYANNTIFVGAKPWKIFSEGNDRNGALVFDDNTKHVFKAHTDTHSTLQLGNWKLRQQDNDLYFNKDSDKFKMANDKILHFNDNWSLKPEGDYFRILKDGNKGGVVDGRRNVDLLIGTAGRYQLKNEGRNDCADANAGNGWHGCNAGNNNQKLYFEYR